MCAAPALVSIGDEGILNAEVSPLLSEVWIDRDLGWLDFNERVLAEGLDPRTPLLERAKFLAIFTSNLDEFFMKRIAAFRKKPAPERIKLLEKLREKLLPILRRQSDCFRKNLVPELEKNGVYLRNWDQFSTSIAFLLHDEQRSTSMYARAKVPTVLRQWVSLASDVG
jgi:polyphosphate kinase